MAAKQKYKVFINDQPVVFTSGDSGCLHAVAGVPDDAALHQFTASLPAGQSLCITSENPAQLWKTFIESHEIIRAAGGVVQTNPTDPRYLMIYRLGRWDLPKGKIDSGESDALAAIREVEEETGISGVRITSDIGDTWHMYRHKGTWKLKQTIWYAMDYSGSEKLIPQVAESITEARWVSAAEMKWLLPDAYASIRELLSGLIQM